MKTETPPVEDLGPEPDQLESTSESGLFAALPTTADYLKYKNSTGSLEQQTAANQKLEAEGILPKGDNLLLAAMPTQLSASDAKLLQNTQAVYASVSEHHAVNKEGERVKLKSLSQEEKKEILKLSPDEKKMFNATLGELAALQAGKVSPATYMVDVMRKAVEISGGDNAKFVKLLSMAFSGGPYKDNERALLGTSYNKAGYVLERAYEHLVNGKASSAYSGFNPNIRDQNPDSTVTHHFREFLYLGFQKGQGVANLANENGDDTVEGNPGDLRNGYFGAMLGGALRNNEITPNDAVNLTQWAFKLGSGKEPPWGNVAFEYGTRGGSPALGDYHLDTRMYNISDWMRDYRERNNK